MPLTPDAKSALSAAIRELRGRLIETVGDHLRGHYRLGVPAAEAGLDEERAARRDRLEAQLAEQVRAAAGGAGAAAVAERERRLEEAVAAACATLVNRLVFLRLMETLPGPDGRPLRRERIVTGGWSSPGYREFRAYAGVLLEDESEGYATLLDLVFADLAVDLPGLFGPVGVTPLIPIPVAALRLAVERLDDPALAPAWDDDTTFGWIYQFWNDPVREALDARIRDGGKIAPHEIAAKTQLFTERYMVDWLLQNSLGPTWRAICAKNGWPCEADTVLPALEAKRADWRDRREAGAVTLDQPLPIAGPAEARWAYAVARDLPEDAVAAAPDSLGELKLLDPACGSGHFLVIAMDLLFAFHREEARHRGVDRSDAEIVRGIVEDNLHGIDIDPRAVQIAAAALYLKAQTLAPGVAVGRMNLVAPAFDLAGLPDDDPALRSLLAAVHDETGLPEEFTRRLVRALEGASHLGSLLKVEHAIADELLSHQVATGEREPTLDAWAAGHVRDIREEDAAAAIEAQLEAFLARHTDPADLGLRLDGEQLAAGLRFLQLNRPGRYHVVVANPPYLNTTSIRSFSSKKIKERNIYASFIKRCHQLTCNSGIFSVLTMRSWLYSYVYSPLRIKLFSTTTPYAIADLSVGAFSTMQDDVVSVALFSCFNRKMQDRRFVGLLPTSLYDKTRDAGRTSRKRAALSCCTGESTRDIEEFRTVKEWSLIFQVDSETISRMGNQPDLGSTFTVLEGLGTRNDIRYVRSWWEIASSGIAIHTSYCRHSLRCFNWVPFVKGSADADWIEPLRTVLNWRNLAEELRNDIGSRYGRGSTHYFRKGVSFGVSQKKLTARVHRYESVIGDAGAAIFDGPLYNIASLLKRKASTELILAFGGNLNIKINEISALPVFEVPDAEAIYDRLDAAFTEHEAARETSVEFRRPGRSAWRYAQDWAQRAVDRPAGDPLPAWAPVHDDPAPVDPVSFALGVALGRFGAGGEGILDAAPADALPAGLLFLSLAEGGSDDLDVPAAAPIRAAWAEHGAAIAPRAGLRDWLALRFFKDDHLKRYENRPIWLPLSSRDRNFVCFAAIHRWDGRTLATLRADKLRPELTRLTGERDAARTARTAAADPAARQAAEARADRLTALVDELTAFEAMVAQVERLGPPAGPGAAREVDAPFALDLDDGVMVNAAGLWPLLAPQWSKPVQWWKELSQPAGRKDYDWSRLAARWWPSRVDAKCRCDPSLAVAHGCFWRYHPDRAYAWELRLQDEIAPDFTLPEPDADACRARFLEERPEKAAEVEEKEWKRRERKRRERG